MRKASGFLFFLLGAAVIALVVLARRGQLPPDLGAVLHVLDLPVLFIAFLYGGSSLYVSLAKGRTSVPLLLGIFIPLGLLFGALAYFNFGTPLPAF